MREFHGLLARRRSLDLECARVFAAIERLGLHLHQGASSVSQLAEEGGMTLYSARELEDVGRALFFHPEIADDVAEGRMPIANAAILGRVDPEDDFLREDDDWVGWARTVRPREYARIYHQRVDQVRRGRPVRPLTMFVTSRDIEDFEEARKFASRSAREVLTAGQTLRALLDVYLEEHDPLWKARLLPGALSQDAAPAGDAGGSDAATRPGSRYVPAGVRRAVLRRTWNQCAVPFCHKDMFLHFSHRQAHREGGTREAENLDLLCGWHHTLYEIGFLIIEGPADDPVFKTRTGRVLGEDSSGFELLEETEAEKAEFEARLRRRAEAAAAAAAAAKAAEDEAAIARQKSAEIDRSPCGGPPGSDAPSAEQPAAPPVSPEHVPPFEPFEDRDPDVEVPLDAFYPRKGEGFGIWPVR